MRHCPNPDCPGRPSTDSAAEYPDVVESCPECGIPLRDGPAPPAEAEGDAAALDPVTVATFPHPHEAHLARIALESHALAAEVHFVHGQYPSAASWVHLHVARRDLAVAVAVLERGPLVAVGAAGESIETTAPRDARRRDELRPLRLQRRFDLARWFLWTQAVGALPWTFALVPVFVVPAVLALWSKAQPRAAFGVAFGVQVVVLFVAVLVSGPAGLFALSPLLAVYFAWVGSRADPPELLVASPYPAAPAVEIGDAWDVPPVEPPERTFRLARRIAIATGIAVLAWIGWVLLRPYASVLVRGQEIALEADTASALTQELRLGQARLAHELHRNDVPYEAIEIPRPGTLEAVGIEQAAMGRAETVLRGLFPGWGVERSGEGSLLVVVPAEERERIVADALRDVLDRLRRELDAAVVSVGEASAGKIEVRLRAPGEWTPERIRETFPEPLTFEIREVVYPETAADPASWMPPDSRETTVAMFGGRLPRGTELVPQTMGGAFDLYWPVRSVPIIVGRDLLDVKPETDPWGEPALSFELSEEAGRRLEDATRRCAGRKMALVLCGGTGARAISVPVIRGVIGTRGIIQGSFTVQEAEALARELKAGSRALWLDFKT